MLWLAFGLGVGAGAVVVWLWMRAELVRVETARRVSDDSAKTLGATFQSLADSALRSNQSAFLDAARSTLETVRAQMTGDLVQRQTAIEGLVRPLNDSLEKLDSQVRQMELARQKVFGSLGEQLQSLAKETVALSTALRSPQARGRWGEITLRRVAELSGMVKNCDFDEQATQETANGRIRPDMIVRLPGGRSLIVDAKVPLTAYVEAVNAENETVRRAALQRHSQQVAEHVRQLSNKQYWTQFQPAPELVVLFLPGDHFFSAALEQKPGLIEDALAAKVVIATPVTLISVLKGIAYGWNQEQLAENAEQIRETAAAFYERLIAVGQYYGETGRLLERTVESYNKSVGSWESRLLPALRKMRELGVSSGEEPQGPQPVNVLSRRPRAVGE
jgi:DNA recombination protein RmuC